MVIMNGFVLYLLCIMKVLLDGKDKGCIKGIWHDSDELLYLAILHQEIMKLKKVILDKFSKNS